MKILQSIVDLIATGPFVHLTTINADGSPQVTVVWMAVENDEFVVGHLGAGRKMTNIERDPRVTFSMLGLNTSGILREYLVVYGQARITDGGARPLLQSLAEVYLGPGAVFPFPPDPSRQGRVIRIKADRFAGVGPWVSTAE